jgi:hypothetical protein
MLSLRPVPIKPREEISIDFVVGLPLCDGFDAIWVVIDRLLKMRHFIPSHTTIYTVRLARLLIWQVQSLHRLRTTIVSDPRLQFGSTFCGPICSRVGLDWQMSTALHHPMDGQTERINARMVQHLGGVCSSSTGWQGTVASPGWISVTRIMRHRSKRSVCPLLKFKEWILGCGFQANKLWSGTLNCCMPFKYKLQCNRFTNTFWSKGNEVHRQKCKSTIGCAIRTPAHVQLIATFPWTPAQRAAYSHL